MATDSADYYSEPICPKILVHLTRAEDEPFSPNFNQKGKKRNLNILKVFSIGEQFDCESYSVIF